MLVIKNDATRILPLLAYNWLLSSHLCVMLRLKKWENGLCGKKIPAQKN